MRRLLLLALVAPAALLLLVGAWASCSDDYRDVLPFRGFDAAPQDMTRDLIVPPPADMARPADLNGGSDGGAGDAGTGDAGTGDAGASDAGAGDAGASDAGTGDAGATDAGLTG